ncbi:MAG: hypothetical protein J7D61_16020 [Marichromatium sp.]|nr:hypothetical protein [Marichromatium sp.]
MKKEKSTTSVVTHHIVHTAILFPFFGLLAGYFFHKFSYDSLNPTTLMILKDFVMIAIFFLGVKYSLSYINKKYIVQNPEKSSTISITVFGVLIGCALTLNILSAFSIIGIVYNTIFFGIVFMIFFINTKKYFTGLSVPNKTDTKHQGSE